MRVIFSYGASLHVSHSRPSRALELKGRMLAVTRLRVLDAGADAVESQLAGLVEQMPDAVRGMPVVLDAAQPLDLAALLAKLRATGMQPLGVTEGMLADAARDLGLAVLCDDAPEPAAHRPDAKPLANAPARRSAHIVDRPVRSGQQIYAEGTDLIVTGAVNTGAELIADGCVHVYGPLRGRVIAGARGDVSARVFARKFEAELVAIAGVYAIADQIQGVCGFATQAFLDEGRLRIELMNG